MALTGRDGQKLAEALDELATSRAAAGLAVETSTMSNCFRRRLPAVSYVASRSPD